jgi:hypothetical protein
LWRFSLIIVILLITIATFLNSTVIILLYCFNLTLSIFLFVCVTVIFFTLITVTFLMPLLVVTFRNDENILLIFTATIRLIWNTTFLVSPRLLVTDIEVDLAHACTSAITLTIHRKQIVDILIYVGVTGITKVGTPRSHCEVL